MKKGLEGRGGKGRDYVPMSPATSESNPEKTTSQSLNSLALHSLTTMSAISPFIGAACFHRTASLYFLPADRADAPTAWSLREGWFARRRMKRWPTEPVAPRTPVGQYLAIVHDHLEAFVAIILEV